MAEPHSARPEASPAHVVVTALGRPAPQGSKLRTRFGLVDDNAKTLKPWREAVTAAAKQARETTAAATITGPVVVDATITLPRPAGHHRTGRHAHLLRDDAPGWPIARGNGDADKYLRAICDALTDAQVWEDDAQVVEGAIRKVYPASGVDALDQPGAVIRVRRIGPRS